MNDTSYTDGASEYESNEQALREEAIREERRQRIAARLERNPETFHQALGRISRKN